MDRRRLLLTLAATSVTVPAARASTATTPSPDALAAAAAALTRHRDRIPLRDWLAVVDLRRPSSQPRFHLIELATGVIESYLVAHGRGSDPDNSGLAIRLSDRPGSLASCAGAFATGAAYQSGSNGPAMLLEGLDDGNRNARERQIIVHAAPYVAPAWIARHGKPGRSWGCFVLDPAIIESVRMRMSGGRLLYAHA